jgi:hypothetical protein
MALSNRGGIFRGFDPISGWIAPLSGATRRLEATVRALHGSCLYAAYPGAIGPRLNDSRFFQRAFESSVNQPVPGQRQDALPASVLFRRSATQFGALWRTRYAGRLDRAGEIGPTDLLPPPQ